MGMRLRTLVTAIVSSMGFGLGGITEGATLRELQTQHSFVRATAENFEFPTQQALAARLEQLRLLRAEIRNELTNLKKFLNGAQGRDRLIRVQGRNLEPHYLDGEVLTQIQTQAEKAAAAVAVLGDRELVTEYRRLAATARRLGSSLSYFERSLADAKTKVEELDRLDPAERQKLVESPCWQ